MISNLFTNTSGIHSYNTRSADSYNFYIKRSRLEIQRNAFPRIGTKLWNEIPCLLRGLPKPSFKKGIIQSVLPSIFEEVDSFIDIHQIISEVISSVTRLRLVPIFPQGYWERAKRERAWKSLHVRKARRGGGEREIFLSHRLVSPFSRGVILTRVHVSLALLSLSKNRDYS